MTTEADKAAAYIIAGLAALLDRYVTPLNRVNIFSPQELRVLAILGHDYLSAIDRKDVEVPFYRQCESCLCSFGVARRSPICAPFATQ